MISSAVKRRQVLGFLVFACAACRRSEGDRCGFCGMKIDPSSPWRAELVQDGGHRVEFDTPRCALLAWRTGRVAAAGASFQEFYSREWRDGGQLRFALGSDVVGPMGPDAVPVDPALAAKFTTDHHAARVLALGALTADVLSGLS
ncbi:MAG TPA: nitrous oxide reductase accessory protein NosL [Polyangiaceae bacterium]|jgi:hypothetical protein